MSDVKSIPDGYSAIIPMLVVDGGAAAIDFYTRVLGATERMRMPGPDGKVMHAELLVGDSVFMLADAMPDMGYHDPLAIGGTPVTISAYVPDVDAAFARALAAGATEMRPVTDEFYGDRTGSFIDPFGHRWSVATHIEDVSPDEMAKRAEKVMNPPGN